MEQKSFALLNVLGQSIGVNNNIILED